MSNEKNETTGGEHNADRPIKTQLDLPYFKEKGIRELVYSPFEIFEGSPTLGNTIKLSLSESLRVIEATVKYLNQTKDEGRHEIRTLKDKDNQKVVNILLKQYKTAKASLKSNTLHLKEGALRDLTSKEFMDIEEKCDNLREMISRIEGVLEKTDIDLTKL